MTESKLFQPFYGHTNADGTRVHDCPSSWPFGTVGPVSPYTFRYAPDSAVYEKQPKEKTTTIAATSKIDISDITEVQAASVFSTLTNFLTSLGDKS